MKMMENKRQRLRHYLGAPVRFLRKARDVYVDSMVSFDGRVSKANVVPCPGTHLSHIQYLPNNFVRHGPKQTDGHDENLREIYRSLSSKYHWNRMDLNQAQRPQAMGSYSAAAMDTSYGIAVGKIGTINEEEPCDFHEEVEVEKDILFARCKSHTITRKNGFYHN